MNIRMTIPKNRDSSGTAILYIVGTSVFIAGPNMSALQDSLYGTDYEVALLSQEDTALHHTRSPRCSGSLLRGSLAITTTGLPPVSHQNLSRRTI